MHSPGKTGAVILRTILLHSQHFLHQVSAVPQIPFCWRLICTDNHINQSGTPILEAAGTSKWQEEATHKQGGLQSHDSEAQGVDQEREGHDNCLVTSPSFKGCGTGEFQSSLTTKLFNFQWQATDIMAGTWGTDLQREEFKEGPLHSTIREQQASVTPWTSYYWLKVHFCSK